MKQVKPNKFKINMLSTMRLHKRLKKCIIQ